MGHVLSTSARLDRFFDAYYRHRPVSATFIGVHDYAHQLPDYSPGAVARQLAETRALLDQVDSGVVTSPADRWEAIDRLLARNFLRTQIWELSEPHVLSENPCLYTGDRQGSTFSLRGFHDEFLAHGSIPVALTARLMRGEPLDVEGYAPPTSGRATKLLVSGAATGE